VERGIIYIACTQYQEFPREVFSNHYFCEDWALCEEVYWQRNKTNKGDNPAVAEQNKKIKNIRCLALLF
jgi:hypothetical protein